MPIGSLLGPMLRALLWATQIYMVLWCFGSAILHAEERHPRRDNVVAAYYPPLMIQAEGPEQGIAIDILREAARRNDRELTLEFAPFRRAMATIQQRSDTLMPALFRSTARETEFQWIARIHTTKLRFLSLDAPIDTLDQARKLNAIGVESGSTGDRFLTKLGFKNLIFLSNPDSTAQMLSARRVDAWALTKPLAQSVWNRLSLKQELFAGIPILETPVFLTAGLEFPAALARDYRETVDKMHADGSIRAILKKYQ